MNMIATLKINYLERSGNGLYLRFNAVDFQDTESFNSMRFALKNHKTTRWNPAAGNGKGAWFIYPDVFMIYADRFINFDAYRDRLDPIRKNERSYTGDDWYDHFRQQYGGRSTPPRYNPAGDQMVVMQSFNTLGVSLSSTPQEVKQAYHTLAFKRHPDQGGNHNEMIKLNAAYEVARKYAASHVKVSA